MKKPTRKQTILITLALIIIAVIVYAFLPGAVPVETASVKLAPMQVTVEEEGRTHVKELYTIYSPISGYVRRIDIDEGDLVKEGEVLVQMEPPRSSILDPRSRTEAEARVEAAQAFLKQAKVRADQAIKERERTERLARGGSATSRQLEQAQTEAARAIAALNATRAELSAAKARLARASEESSRLPVNYALKAPVSGRVLTIHHKSERPINAGAPLIAIGNTDSLEVHIEVLSKDAVRISSGTRVILKQWGKETPLEATVTRVEHQGKEQVSALGVEEQRVQVIAEFKSPHKMWNKLGAGYRVLASFIVWEGEDVLQIPTSALFRTDGGWAVFIVQDDEAVRQTVKVGHQTGLTAQILEGLSEGDMVIVHPGTEVKDGAEVEIN